MVDPLENEADYLFVIRNNKDVSFTIEEIVHLAKGLSLPQIRDYKNYIIIDYYANPSSKRLT